MLAILGGTFDPIHNGHLLMASRAMAALPIEKLFFVPCKNPVHRTEPVAHEKHRLAMLQLALQEHPEFQIDTRELDRETPSFMIDTLRSFQQDFPHRPLVLIIGADSYLKFTSWKSWQEILSLAILAVVERPGYLLKEMPIPAMIVPSHADISATEIREHQKLFSVPEAVRYYMEKHELY